MPDFDIGPIDLTIAGLYIVVVLGIGLWLSRAQKDSNGSLSGGRSALWPIVGLSLMSANLSGTSYVGRAGSGHNDGIAVWNYEWMATLCLVFFANSDAPELDADMTFTRNTWRDESRDMAQKSWYQNVRYLGLGVVLVALATVALFV